MERAESPLLVDRVDLADDAVDLVIELDPPLLPLGAHARDVLDRLVPLGEGIRAEAAGPQPLERLPLALEFDPLVRSETVDPDREIALGRGRDDGHR